MSASALSIREFVRGAAQRLAAAGIKNALLDAQVLAAEAAGLTRAQLMTTKDGFSPAAEGRFRAMVARRERREPLAYIVGHREFFSLDFEVTPAVLIPRPETETLVAAALEFLKSRGTAPRVLDLGTGSGCIAIAIAVNAPGTRVAATDISRSALEVATRNAARLGCGRRVDFFCSDLFEALGARARFDLMVCNPPYVAADEITSLQREVRDFEPPIALSGDRGDFFLPLAAGAQRYLKAGGRLMVEVGAGQAAQVRAKFLSAGLSGPQTISDLAGIARVVHAVQSERS